ncbi:Osmosensitive K+ channel histidine kinase KdpD [Klebsiella pneumoniae]|uniref:histidine kinase n=1 Tax=Klebsiella pneumoniae TaxID=573 RepID=A0A2X1QLJ6_KLEPN|nr:Osmosensitive K+ channel histidine kinase KdpD [Klebsiella pneumoniae]
MAVALCAIITLVAMQWLMAFEAANLVMLYLLGVVLIALVYGRWPSVLADGDQRHQLRSLFCRPARDAGGVGCPVSAHLRRDAHRRPALSATSPPAYATRRGWRATVNAVPATCMRCLKRWRWVVASRISPPPASGLSPPPFRPAASCCSRTPQGKLLPLTHQPGLTPWDDAIARWSFDKGQPAGAGTDTLPGVPYQILPLKSAARTWGLLVVEPENLRQLMIPEQQRLLETFTLLVASALERLTLTASEEQARLTSERESLRNSLLAALSHDLRTPLTVLFGQAEILTLDLASEGSKHAPQANEIRQHVLNTTRLVNNLLDMARIQSGGFNLHKEWLTLEEVVGSALRMLEPSLGGQHIQLDLPDPLQLVHVDGPLFERVLINLLENAHKYAGARASIGIRAEADARQLSLEVWDNGPGIPAGQEQTIFDKFARGNKESAIPGVGLGLAICQAIVDVHGGTISASNRPEGGASFRVTLPGETPPELEELPEEL